MSTIPLRPLYPRRFGPYVLIEALDDDPLDQVSLAFTGDPGMEVLCVVQRLPRHLSEDAALSQRFRDCAAVARRLSHGNLVATYAVGQVDREPYIAQEHVDGHDLSDVVARCQAERTRLPLELAPYIVGQAARGLAYAHELARAELGERPGMAHGALSGAKIRLSYAGEVKVLGLGLTGAKAPAPPAVEAERRRDRARFRAPELREDQPGDRRADIYALGVVLWELVTARRYLPGKSPELPSRIEPGVPHALDWVVSKALARGPEQRFQTADELRLTLAECLPTWRNSERMLSELMAQLYDVRREREERRALVTTGANVRARRSSGPNPMLPVRGNGAAEDRAATPAPVLAPAAPPVEASPAPARRRAVQTRTERYRLRVVASAAFAVSTLLTMVAVVAALRYASEHPAVANEVLAPKPASPATAVTSASEPPLPLGAPKGLESPPLSARAPSADGTDGGVPHN